MNPTRNAVRTLAIATVLAISGPLQASGNHAGAHGHSADETAVGEPGVAADARRTITVGMGDDMRFTPSHIRVKHGETIRFLLQNHGQVPHEWSLGTQKELLEHLETMKKHPEMEHDEPGKLTLAPGARGEVIWRFTRPGTVHFACLLPGHYEAGMKGRIQVSRQ